MKNEDLKSLSLKILKNKTKTSYFIKTCSSLLKTKTRIGLLNFSGQSPYPTNENERDAKFVFRLPLRSLFPKEDINLETEKGVLQ